LLGEEVVLKELLLESLTRDALLESLQREDLLSFLRRDEPGYTVLEPEVNAKDVLLLSMERLCACDPAK
jgi:hypothetical protein